jgi:hypothetical protein
MATPRGAEHRDLEQRFRDIERKVDALTASVLKQRQLQVSAGDFGVSGGGSVVVQDGGSVQVLGGGSVEVSGGGAVTVDGTPLAAVTADVVQWDDNSLNVATSWTTYGAANLTVPTGYTRAMVSCFVSAGETFNTGSGGIISVAAKINSVTGAGISNQVPSNAACSAGAFLTVDLTGLSAGASIPCRCLATRTGGVASGTGNIHISASAIFLRS